MAAMRTGTAYNPTRGDVVAGPYNVIPPGARRPVDLDAGQLARALERGTLILEDLEPAAELEEAASDAGAVDLSEATSLDDVSAGDVRAYLEAVAAADPVNLDEVARIRALEAAGKARTSLLALADKIATTPAPQE